MRSACLPLLLACLMLPPAASASGRGEPATQPSELRESVRRVEQETGGRVLRVEPVRRGGQDVYRMKVLTPEGRVRVMQDDRRREGARRPARSEPAPSRSEAAAPRDDRGGRPED